MNDAELGVGSLASLMSAKVKFMQFDCRGSWKAFRRRKVDEKACNSGTIRFPGSMTWFISKSESGKLFRKYSLRELHGLDSSSAHLSTGREAERERVELTDWFGITSEKGEVRELNRISLVLCSSLCIVQAQ